MYGALIKELGDVNTGEVKVASGEVCRDRFVHRYCSV